MTAGVEGLRHQTVPPSPAADPWALLRQAREALKDLLNDTQHREHDCGDEKYCPVLYARRPVAAINEALQEPRA